MWEEETKDRIRGCVFHSKIYRMICSNHEWHTDKNQSEIKVKIVEPKK